ncbi:hypothetical protein PMI07_001189 [Rhizobium sp. CF080]|nr:hypothetical protein PMI07_001189 [Rhizobium sp. CF080]
MVIAIKKTTPAGRPAISPTRGMTGTERFPHKRHATPAHVILGLDPRIHSLWQSAVLRSILLGLAWILGSSPRMTAERRRHRATQKQRPWVEGSYRTAGGLL